MDQINQTFKNKFEVQHRDLKSAIHLCQYQAYKNKVQLADAYSESKQCFLPLLLIRQHAKQLITQAAKTYEDCYNKSGNKEVCLKSYEQSLNSKSEELELKYKKYVLNGSINKQTARLDITPEITT